MAWSRAAFLALAALLLGASAAGEEATTPNLVDMTACPSEFSVAPGQSANISIEVHQAGVEPMIVTPIATLRPGIDDDGKESVGLVSMWKIRAEQSKITATPDQYVPGRFKLSAPETTENAADHVEVVLGFANGTLAHGAAPLILRAHLGEGTPADGCVASAFIVTPSLIEDDPVSMNGALLLGLALGGGALALGVASASRARRAGQAWWGLGALLPLYTRLTAANLLDQSTRQRVFAAIQARPGVNFSQLRVTLSLSTGVVDHHTRSLQRGGLIVSRREGRYRAYYPQGVSVPIVTHAPQLGDTASRLLALVRQREMTYADLMANLGLSKAGVSHHVHALQTRGLVVLVRVEDGRWVVRAVHPVQSSS